jgi:hypothetical protein
MPTTVFFGTNRRRKGDGTDPSHYAGEASEAGVIDRMTFGRAVVGDADLARLRTGPLLSLENIAKDSPTDEMLGDLAGGRNLLIFLHGFANSFSDALTRAAFNRDWLAAAGLAEADCTVFAFSWPSGGYVVRPGDVVPGLLFSPMTVVLKVVGVTASPLATAYFDDRAAALGSAADIVSILDRLRPAIQRVRRKGRVFLLAHSMGNLALQGALELWADRGLPRTTLFDEAISAAADTDWQGADGTGPIWLRLLAKLSGRVSLYHSEADNILRLSQVVNDMQRLGRSGPPDITDRDIYPPASFRFVDCAGAVDDGPGSTFDSPHQFYRRVPAVRDDIAKVMAGGGRSGRSKL